MKHIVDFANHCKNCEHSKVPEEEFPCYECLQNPVNDDSKAPIFYKGPIVDEFRENAYSHIEKLDDFLYYTEYMGNLDYDYADYLYSQKGYFGDFPGACTSIRKGNFLGRNFDFPYDNRCSFAIYTPHIHRKYSILGVAGAISDLTEDYVSKGKYSPMYRILPFQLQDGINSVGLCMSTNVVPTDKGFNITKPTLMTYHKVCSVALIRFVLERFVTATNAVKYLRDYVSIYFPKALHEMGYEQHWLISDRVNSYVLEIVDNKLESYNVLKMPWITNFYITDVIFNSDRTVYTPETQDSEHNAIVTNHITPNGSGLERHNLVAERYNSLNSKIDMQNILRDLRYTRAYSTSDDVSNPYWYTEFVGVNGETVASSPERYSDTVRKAGTLFLSRSRDTAKTWQTVHSSVYNMENKHLYLKSQERDTEYEFSVYGGLISR